MSKPSSLLTAFTWALAFLPPLFAQVDSSSNLARNPIVWADVPDLAAIRVGDTYYLSSTTMHLSPGLPILKSKDLVNWQLPGYRFALFHYATQTAGGVVDFDCFRVSEKITGAP